MRFVLLLLVIGHVAWAFDDYNRLSHAVENGQLTKVRQLLGQGMDINQKDDDGLTPIMVAAKAGQIEIAKYLIKHGANINFYNFSDENAVLLAVQEKHFDILQLLLENKARPDIKIEKSGMTPLLVAIQNNELPAVKLLVDAGASTSEKNKEGFNALELAKKLNQAEIIEFLSKGKGQ